MEKVIVPKGTKQDFSDIFDDLQNYIAVNFERRFNRLIDQSHGASYGIIMEQRNESFAGTETSFSTTITDTAGGDSSNLTFTSGQAIVRNATTNHTHKQIGHVCVYIEIYSEKRKDQKRERERET